MKKRIKTDLQNESGFLRDLVLLRNDPDLVNDILDHALSGNADAQYALGLVYAEGRGTEEDLVKAYAWLSVCAKRGDEDANTLRFVVGERMSDSQFTESLAMVGELEKSIQTCSHEAPNKSLH